jgi:hypothetical protein
MKTFNEPNLHTFRSNWKVDQDIRSHNPFFQKLEKFSVDYKIAKKVSFVIRIVSQPFFFYKKGFNGMNQLSRVNRSYKIVFQTFFLFNKRSDFVSFHF